jgi:glutathione-regulated potassium-efflux system ancillary protein KefF
MLGTVGRGTGKPEIQTGVGGFTIEEVLTPLRASCLYTGMSFSKPLAFLGAAGAGAEALRGYQDALAARLREEPRRG